jgi:hypothetical protein
MLPAVEPGRAMQLVAVLRERRGRTHLLAVVVSRVVPEVAHAMKRPHGIATFGWAPAPAVTDADRASLDAAEALTDRLLIKAYDALDDGAKAVLLAGTKAIGAALGISASRWRCTLDQSVPRARVSQKYCRLDGLQRRIQCSFSLACYLLVCFISRCGLLIKSLVKK